MESWLEFIKLQIEKCKVFNNGFKGFSRPNLLESYNDSLFKKDSVQTFCFEKENLNDSNSNLCDADFGPDPDEKITIDDFEMLTVIGQGSFGKVVQARFKRTDQIFAMKILNKRKIISQGEVEHTRTEKQILQSLKHPFLVCLHYSFQTQDKLYLVMDFVNGGEIFHHIQLEQCFDNERARFYAAEIILGLEYLHNHGIIYRDLKPENLLLESGGHVKITDFGLSKRGLFSPGDRTKSFCGTPEYLAPEILNRKEYGKAVDWWSLGTLIYEMLTGLPAFYDEDLQKMYALKISSELEIPEKIDSNAADIIRRFLEREPDLRLQDPSEIKRHAWFHGIDWEALERLEIEPTYKPSVSVSSIDFIDAGFLGMTMSDVKSDPKDNLQAHFEDFTYKREN